MWYVLFLEECLMYDIALPSAAVLLFVIVAVLHNFSIVS